jgi:hypothetical protein
VAAAKYAGLQALAAPHTVVSSILTHVHAAATSGHVPGTRTIVQHSALALEHTMAVCLAAGAVAGAYAGAAVQHILS